MSLLSVGLDYIYRMVNVPGLKSFLFDSETILMVGLCITRSSLLAHQVFAFERIDQEEKTGRNSMQFHDAKSPSAVPGVGKYHHLKAIVFIRPCESSVERLVELLRSQRYREYHVFFSHLVPVDLLTRLAEADHYHCIKSVHEYYLDYYALSHHCFTAELRQSKLLYTPPAYFLSREKQILYRNIEAVASVCLGLKKRPEIRFAGKSEPAKLIALGIAKMMKEEAQLFGHQQNATAGGGPSSSAGDSSLLVILDRRDDPVTPLLSQWTYQAMVHELLGIQHNCVNLSAVAGVRRDMQEVVLNAESDPFYRGSQFLNFGDLGNSIKTLVQEYQRKTKTSTKLDSIEDMQKFVDSYPEFRQLSGNVSKHVTIVHELSRLVTERQLMYVSEIEQELACSEDFFGHTEKVQKLMAEPKVRFEDKLRVALIFVLRYEAQLFAAANSAVLHSIKRALANSAPQTPANAARIALVDEIVKYSGDSTRSGDLFGNHKGFLARATQLLSSGIRGVENIYTQHKPFISEMLTEWIGGRIDGKLFPVVDSNGSISQQSIAGLPNPSAASSAPKASSGRLLILYMFGGFTYEELSYIENLNRTVSGVKILLGGSAAINSQAFLDDLTDEKYRDNSLFDK